MRAVLVAATASLVIAGATPSAEAPPELQPFAFLIGSWEASGSGQPGAGAGTAVFARALQDRVIVRTSYAEYPAAAGRPASRHDDLMVVYPASGGVVRADYHDSEGHVIRYVVQSPASGQAVFLSEATASEPRYRLTYRLDSAGVLKGEFAIAPPGTPDAFRTYLTWDSHRVKVKK